MILSPLNFFKSRAFRIRFLLIDIDKGCRSGRFGLDGTKNSTISDFNFAFAISECLSSTPGLHNMDGNCSSASFGPMPSWDTSLVTNMSHAFSQYPDFNAIFPAGIPSNVVDMSAMFESASLFDQDIGLWVTSKVTNMTQAFADASSFNQNIGRGSHRK